MKQRRLTFLCLSCFETDPSRHSCEGRNPDKELDPGSKPAPDPDPGSGMTEEEKKASNELTLLRHASYKAEPFGEETVKPIYRLVLLRHGESVWNKANRFTGWTDVDLSEAGIAEARQAGELLVDQGYGFDLACTSVLKRAIRTLWIVQDIMDLMWIPVLRSWRLNERHYGALQGLNKAETASRFGDEQVQAWRRSYDVRPPALEETDERYPGRDPRYAGLDPADLPRTECLRDTVERFLPYWEQTIVPEVRAGTRVLIVAHGNSLRALVKHLEKMPDDEIVGLNIPTGVPLVYDLDRDLNVLGKTSLGDPDRIRKAMEAVRDQGQSSPS